MDEIIVRVARAIASRSRLRLLAYLTDHGEQTPTALAKALGTPLNTISGHMRILSTAGLVRGRRSAGHCYYLAESPYGARTLSGRISAWLAQILRSADVAEDHSGLPEVRNDFSRAAMPPYHHAVFEIATAFTDLRRLQILRYLSQHQRAPPSEIMGKLHMSGQAVTRHAQKLCRRGFVAVQRRDGRRHELRLCSEFRTPDHLQMLKIVRESWKP